MAEVVYCDDYEAITGKARVEVVTKDVAASEAVTTPVDVPAEAEVAPIAETPDTPVV